MKTNLLINHSLLALVTLLTLSPLTAHAQDKEGNGGGAEIRFKWITTQTTKWLERYLADGTLTKKLHLDKSGFTAETVVKGYKDAVSSTLAVKFLKQENLAAACKSGDQAACALSESSRICVNYSNPKSIECNQDLFQDSDGDEQYSINFHEYLGVAGIEKNLVVKNEKGVDNSYSQYPISQYLMTYAAPEKEIRFVLGGDNVACRVYQMPFHIPGFVSTEDKAEADFFLSRKSERKKAVGWTRLNFSSTAGQLHKEYRVLSDKNGNELDRILTGKCFGPPHHGRPQECQIFYGGPFTKEATLLRIEKRWARRLLRGHSCRK